MVKRILAETEEVRYYAYRLVALNGYGFSRPIRHARVEDLSGYGLTERIRADVKNKENTWCGASVDFRSHIKFSPVPCAQRTGWTVAQMTHRTN